MNYLWHITAQVSTALQTCSATCQWEPWHAYLKKKLIPPFGLLSKRCVSGFGNISMGLKKRPLPDVCTVIGNWLIKSRVLYAMALKPKGPLTWEGMVKISWNSRRLFLWERHIDGYYFQPNKSRWTVPLNNILNVGEWPGWRASWLASPLPRRPPRRSWRGCEKWHDGRLCQGAPVVVKAWLEVH
jgi:hypothetical protein